MGKVRAITLSDCQDLPAQGAYFYGAHGCIAAGGGGLKFDLQGQIILCCCNILKGKEL